MNCKETEQEIYLYRELTASEKATVDEHIGQCVACQKLFISIQEYQSFVNGLAENKPQPANHARLTSSIMQAINQHQNQKTTGLNSLFVRYAMVAASLSLIVLFGAEQLEPNEFNKRQPVARAVVLESTSLSKIFLKGKEKSESRLSLYACAKTGDCDNVFIKNLIKKSF